MSELNTVTVLIYGQEYTLSGDMPREHIMRLADTVDAKMREISQNRDLTVSKTAVLAAMLLTDDYYKEKEDADLLLKENTELSAELSEIKESFDSKFSECKNSYEQILADTKDNYEQQFAEYKEFYEKQLIDTKQLYEATKNEYDEYKEQQEAVVETLRATIANQEERYEDLQQVPSEAQQKIDELENRCRDIESSFFDIQMENIRLKNELENYRNR